MKKRGFTLVELLVTLAIGAILLVIAIPGYAFLASSSKLAAATNDLVSSLQMARSEAVKRRMRVTVCKSRSTGSASPACDPSAEWRDGWLIFVDGGTRGIVDADDTVLRVRQRLPTTIIITSNNFSSFISYRPNGVSQGQNGLGNGTLSVCVGNSQRDIIVNMTGRPRLHHTFC